MASCTPCCTCMNLRLGTTIVAIFMIIFGAIWTLICLACLGITGPAFPHLNTSFLVLHLVSYVGGFLMSAFMIGISVLLLLGACQRKRRFVYVFIVGSIIVPVASFVIAIALEIWYRVAIATTIATFDYGHHYGVAGWSFVNTFWYGFTLVFCIVYPWWVSYVFYYEMGGKVWSNCCRQAQVVSRTPSQRSTRPAPGSYYGRHQEELYGGRSAVHSTNTSQHQNLASQKPSRPVIQSASSTQVVPTKAANQTVSKTQMQTQAQSQDGAAGQQQQKNKQQSQKQGGQQPRVKRPAPQPPGPPTQQKSKQQLAPKQN